MSDLKKLDALFVALSGKEDKARYAAFKELCQLTEGKADWIYDKFYGLAEKLTSENSYQRSIGFILLANLSKSDSEKRNLKITERLLSILDDEKFITARLAIQNAWKFAVSISEMEKNVLTALKTAYYESRHLAAHPNLIRGDVILSLRNIYNFYKDEDILNEVKKMIEEENDLKTKKALLKTAGLK